MYLAATHLCGKESINYTVKTRVLVWQSRIQAVKASDLLGGCLAYLAHTYEFIWLVSERQILTGMHMLCQHARTQRIYCKRCQLKSSGERTRLKFYSSFYSVWQTHMIYIPKIHGFLYMAINKVTASTSRGKLQKVDATIQQRNKKKFNFAACSILFLYC